MYEAQNFLCANSDFAAGRIAIIACGLADYPVVSLSDLLSPVPDMPRVKREVVSAFAEVFNHDVG